MPSQVDISPAVIIQQWIIDERWGADPNVIPMGKWPVYVATVPSGSGSPSDLVTVYDTGETPQGVKMRTGEQAVRFNYQIAVRAKDYRLGYAKIREIATALEKVKRAKIVVVSKDDDGQTTYGLYMLRSARRINVLSTGREPDQLARWLITSNGSASISKLT